MGGLSGSPVGIDGRAGLKRDAIDSAQKYGRNLLRSPRRFNGHRVRERTRAALDGGFESPEGPSNH
ncbi:hypothetical protein HYPDE_33378 [Hyphomicrobium denitrificans 1NES1]|uniref:Uncharacterized protein n=1 Tax=Hyphomicrobium denitrificans 1NES1 TaxID=670307 RepID=N0B5P7_9HYPH|nr:hypothetical protein HYPDE_33378 [Hyphomicrobium denitrificans 1NES1]